MLFIFGHFDDVSVICGTVNMFVRSGYDTHVVWLASAGMGGGIWGTVEDRWGGAGGVNWRQDRA